jgi:cell division protease FtsH
VKPHQKTILLWLLLFLVFAVLYNVVDRAGGTGTEKNFGELLSALENGEVQEIRIRETGKGHEFIGTFSESGLEFTALGVMSDNVLDVLNKAYRDHNTTYTIEAREDGGMWIYILQWLPMLLIIGVFLLFMRQLQSGNGRAMSFGKSRARLMNENQKKVTFSDVAGADESKAELEEIVHFLKDPKKFTRLGGRIPKGVMLMGSPGTGKTLLARAIAGEAGVPFFSIAGSDFVEMFVGVGASRVRDLFEQGKKNAPCIIFIDEIDAVGRHRGAGMGGGHDEREQTLNQLLVEMDGFESNEGVIIIAATNRPDVLDPAILRPGRFDRRVTVPMPDLVGREQILRVHSRRVPLSVDVDTEVIARGSPGMSGADIENLVNEAALIAARADKTKVAMADFEVARDKILMGSERRSMIMTKKDLERTSYHESGHTLVGSLLQSEVDPVHKVTIIPRGRALGLTMRLPDDRTNYSKTYAENLIAILMGGRIAEELIFGEYNTGASDDIDKASDLARRMVCEWGMSAKMGPLSFGKKEGEVFLGRDFAQTKDFSEETAREIDAEVRQIVTSQYERARQIIKDNVDTLHTMAKLLLEYETLNTDDIRRIMDGEEITRDKPEVRIRTREQMEEERLEREQKDKAQDEKQPIISGPLPEPGSA